MFFVFKFNVYYVSDSTLCQRQYPRPKSFGYPGSRVGPGQSTTVAVNEVVAHDWYNVDKL